MKPIPVRKHETAAMDFTLMDGDTAAVLTGLTVHLVLVKSAGNTDYNTDDDGSRITLQDAANGVVRFVPADGEWDSDDTIRAYFWVESGSSYKSYPANEEIVFEIRTVGSGFDPAA